MDQYGEVPFIKKASKVTGQPHYLISLAVLVLLVLSCLTPPGQWICTILFSFLLPAYHSFKAIESENSQDDQKWLTYWIVFGFNFCFEDVIFRLLFWVPLLQLLRVGFLVYMYTSKDSGTEFVFRSYVSPAFGKIKEICGSWVEAFESFAGLDAVSAN